MTMSTIHTPRVEFMYQVQSDGRSVWVHCSNGMTVARFGRFGIDVHSLDSTECLHCTHGETSPEDWAAFVASVKHHYGFVVPVEHRPERLS
jgi:hypothetical protein